MRVSCCCVLCVLFSFVVLGLVCGCLWWASCVWICVWFVMFVVLCVVCDVVGLL